MITSALTKVFADLSDDALLKRLGSGSLTEEAEAIAKAEMLARGLSLPIYPDVDVEPEGALSPEDLVPIARSLAPIEASVIQGRLEAEGVYAFVADANLMNALPIWAHAIYGGGVRVLVRRSQVETAAKILSARDNDEYQLEDDML